MKNKFFQQGFSLPELLLSVGLLGGLSLITMKLTGDSEAGKNYILRSSHISQLVSEVQSAINEPSRCMAIFGATTLAPGIDRGSINNPAVLQNIKYTLPNGTEKIVLESGTPGSPKEYNGVFINSGDIKVMPSAAISDHITDIEITFRLKQAILFSSLPQEQLIKKRFSVSTRIDSSNHVVSCRGLIQDSDVVTRENLCKTLGDVAHWDAITEQCRHVPKICGYGKIPSTIEAFGRFDCANMDTHIPVEDLFEVSMNDCSGPDISLAQGSSNKYTVKCAGKYSPANPPQNSSNCVGGWGSCDKKCGGGTQTFTVTTPQTGTGTCEAKNGDTRSCNTQACAVDDVDCKGKWSGCVVHPSNRYYVNESESFIVSTPQQGKGLACPTSPRACVFPTDCSQWENLPTESGGCWNKENYGEWRDVSSGCKCRDVSGPLSYKCDPNDPYVSNVTGSECAPK